MHPTPQMPAETMMYGGHEIRRADLVVELADGRAALSSVLSGSDERLTPALANKMNIIRGLDVPFYIGHHNGGHLGNWGGLVVDSPDAELAQSYQTPTLDQVLARSPTFYDDLSTNLQRTMVMGESLSYGWSSQETQTDVVRLTAETSSLALFNRIFVPDDEPDPRTERPPVVDRVLESYQSLRQSNRRLSVRDRQRLDEHLERLDELQRRLQVSISCGDQPVPADSQPIRDEPAYFHEPALNTEYWRLFNDVIVTAFLCGTSRIAVGGVLAPFSAAPGDWHFDVAHRAYFSEEAQLTNAQGHQATFEGVMLDLIAKLDAVQDADGTTLLDNTLVQWTQESGPFTHESIDSTIVTAGSAGGCVRTGQLLDYRNLDQWVEQDTLPMNTGLLQQQYYASVLQLLGVPPQEYEREPGGGYPDLLITRDELYPTAVRTIRGDVLPWLSV